MQKTKYTNERKKVTCDYKFHIGERVQKLKCIEREGIVLKVH